jgi:hypothetical protein
MQHSLCSCNAIWSLDTLFRFSNLRTSKSTLFGWTKGGGVLCADPAYVNGNGNGNGNENGSENENENENGNGNGYGIDMHCVIEHHNTQCAPVDAINRDNDRHFPLFLLSLYEIKRSRAVGQAVGASYAPQLGIASAGAPPGTPSPPASAPRPLPGRKKTFSSG